VVERITANQAAAMVLWDGRKSADDVPIRSTELDSGVRIAPQLKRGRGGIGKPLASRDHDGMSTFVVAAMDQHPARAVCPLAFPPIVIFLHRDERIGRVA
jgi:hypothetical protein